MDMAKGTHTLFCNLKVIGNIRQHERVQSRGGDVLDISRHTILEGLTRWWHGESREHNVSAIRSVLDCAFGHINILCDNAHRAAMHEQDLAMMQRLERELRAARGGCASLLSTYEADTVTCAKVTCMIEEIDQHLNRLTRWTGNLLFP